MEKPFESLESYYGREPTDEEVSRHTAQGKAYLASITHAKANEHLRDTIAQNKGYKSHKEHDAAIKVREHMQPHWGKGK